MSTTAAGIAVSRTLYRLLEAWLQQGDVVAHTLFAGYHPNFRYRIYPQTDTANFLDLDGELLSFQSNGKRQHNEADGSWTQAGRQSARPGRVARSLIPEDMLEIFRDTDFEAFANRVKAHAAQQVGSFRLFNGEAIRTLYLGDNAEIGSGSLDKSCMRYAKNQPFFDLYCQNPDHIEMLALINKAGKLIGRSLIWTTEEEGRVMDRVYGSDATVRAFRDWAVKDGIPYRSHNGAEYPQYFTFPQGKRDVTLTVRVPNWRHDLYPYCDTFLYLHEATGVLSNKATPGSYNYTLQQTDGGPRLRRPCRTCGVMLDQYGWQNEGQCYTCWLRVHCRRCEHAFDAEELADTGYCAECMEAMTCVECKRFMTDALYADGFCYDCAMNHQCLLCGYVGKDVETKPNRMDQRCQSCGPRLTRMPNAITVSARTGSTWHAPVVDWRAINDAAAAEQLRQTARAAGAWNEIQDFNYVQQVNPNHPAAQLFNAVIEPVDRFGAQEPMPFVDDEEEEENWEGIDWEDMDEVEDLPF